MKAMIVRVYKYACMMWMVYINIEFYGWLSITDSIRYHSLFDNKFLRYFSGHTAKYVDLRNILVVGFMQAANENDFVN